MLQKSKSKGVRLLTISNDNLFKIVVIYVQRNDQKRQCENLVINNTHNFLSTAFTIESARSCWIFKMKQLMAQWGPDGNTACCSFASLLVVVN